jgi:hypothetical protein
VVGSEIFAVLAPVSAFFCFPVVVLANLESNSLFQPLTWTLVRSFRKLPLYWIGFYLLSLGLLLASNGIIFLESLHPVAAGILYGPTITTLFFLYARLLGRLAWVIDSRLREAAEEEEEEEEASW